MCPADNPEASSHAIDLLLDDSWYRELQWFGLGFGFVISGMDKKLCYLSVQ